MKLFPRNLGWTFAVVTLCLSLNSKSYASDQLSDIYFSDEPLLAKDVGSEVKGLFADFFTMVANEAGRDVRFHRSPWKRAQATVSNGTNVGIGPITRTSKREDQFTWIAPLFPMRIVYLTIKGSGVAVHDLETARNLVVGVKLASTGTYTAKKHGLPEENVRVATTQENLLKMLKSGRIDAWLVWDVIAYRVIYDLDRSTDIVEGYNENLGDLYFAASPGTRPSEVDVWRKSVETVIERGGLKEIMNLYLGREINITMK